MDGKEENEGKVEVCYQGLWGSVVSQSWGFEEASVVCGALGRDQYGNSMPLILCVLAGITLLLKDSSP